MPDTASDAGEWKIENARFQLFNVGGRPCTLGACTRSCKAQHARATFWPHAPEAAIAARCMLKGRGYDGTSSEAQFKITAWRHCYCAVACIAWCMHCHDQRGIPAW